MLSDVSFQCSVTPGDAALTVTYTLRNESDEELGVFNRIEGIATDGGVDFSPDRVYVELDGEVLRFMHQALHTPKGLTMTAYTPPNVSHLPARSTLVETFTVPIPVKVRHPYKRVLIRGEVIPAEPRTAQRVEVSVGVFPLGDECQLEPEHPAYPEVYTATPPDPAVRGQVILSAGFDLAAPVAVLDYKGFPWA